MATFGGVFRQSQFSSLIYRNNLTSNVVYQNSIAGFGTSAEEKLGLNKPKRPLTAFMKFLHQVRPTLISKNPGVGAIQIVKLASKHWEQLNENAKVEMTKEYEKDMEQYRKKKEVYLNSLTGEQKANIFKMKAEISESKERRKMKAELKDLGRPKRPLSSFVLFSQSQKDSVKGKTFTETGAILGEKWRKLPPQEKAVYEKKARDLYESYQKELTAWEQKMIRMGNIDYVRNKALVPDKESKKSPTQ